MSRLELKVPPDLIALMLTGLMWLISRLTPSFAIPLPYRLLVAGGLVVPSGALIVAARVDFARAGTSFNPTALERSHHLVTSGVYGITRNPMYLGTLLALVAWAVLLQNPFSLALSGAFVPYMNRFQIWPEERVLAARFGPTYRAYAAGVRRWV